MSITGIKKIGIKTAKTMAQAALGIIGSAILMGDVNWQNVLSASVLAGITCILMNVKDLAEDYDDK